MSKQLLNLDENLYRYIQSVSLREPSILQSLREETAALGDIARMQISPEQGQFMRLLVELTEAEKLLEIGTFTGYSALSCARALPEAGQLIACDVNETWTAIAKKYWEKAGLSHKIQLRLAPALDTLESLCRETHPKNSFDFIFIDADKRNYDAYYEYGLRLLRPGGLILIDNVLWHGDVADPAVHDPDTVAIRTLNEKIKMDERVSISLLPLADGLTLARKR